MGGDKRKPVSEYYCLECGRGLGIPRKQKLSESECYCKHCKSEAQGGEIDAIAHDCAVDMFGDDQYLIDKFMDE